MLFARHMEDNSKECLGQVVNTLSEKIPLLTDPTNSPVNQY